MRKILQTEDFVLGTFASNCSGGMTVTKLPERWAATWENNEQLGRLLDDAGIDFMLPIARWIGYGGETDFHGTVLETMTWATGLLARTKQITVFATMHVTANHPVVVAKQLATADEISHGRVGLNVVAGWNKPEYEALGLDLPNDHTRRYRYAQEWFDLVNKIWTTEGKFDWNGEFFKVKNCYGNPKPWAGTRPPYHQCRRLRRRAPVRGAQCRFSLHPCHRSVPFQAGSPGTQRSGESRRPRRRGADLLARGLPAD
jgi:alkanesulfonate monooxygenase SsuD/methylene tetrahydromethanopterin reductase-like flavin-dependent oxidoreductase (luciferase family)